MSKQVPRLEIRDLGRRIGARPILDGVSLALAPGEILAVLGESGCGKSTLLRLVAGLDAPSAGEIRIDGRLVAGRGADVPPEARGVGLMFQDYALFPHLTLLANVCFGLGRLGRDEARALGLARLSDVGLADRAESYPSTLSGGEAQRVALARALAPQPRLLLLDEPFSNLDGRGRARLRAETLALLRAARTSAILVTHDRDEAVEFADRIALMRAGRIVQVGTAEDLYRCPVSPFAARALGDVIELSGEARDGRVTTALGDLPSTAPAAGQAHVCLRPEAIRIRPRGEGRPARVLRRSFAGSRTRLSLAVDGLDAPLTLTVPADLSADDGETIGIGLDPRSALVFSSDGNCG